MNEADLGERLLSLHRQYGLEPLQPGEFTVSMYTERVGIKYGTANDELAALVKAGEVQFTDYRIYRGKRVKAYRFVEPA